MADFDFNQDTLEQFKQFQKLKRKKALETVGTGLRNVAEGVASTLGKRGARFRGAPDESDTYMTPEQKAAKAAPIIKGMEEREQFYFGAALKDAQMRFKEKQDNYRALMREATANRGIDQRANTAAARLRDQGIDREMGINHGQQARYMQPSKDTEASAKAVLAAAQAEVQADVDSWVAAHPDMKEARDMGADKATLQATAEALAASRAPQAAAALRDTVLEGAEKLLQELEPGQAVQAVALVQEGAGISDEEMHQAAPELARTVSDLFAANQGELDVLESNERALAEEAQTNARRTGASSAGYQAAADAMMAQFGGARGGPQEVAGGTTVSEVEQQAQAQGEAPEAQEAPPASPYGETYFNDPNLPKVSGDANQRMEDILDLIEQHPEHPPLQEARNQLLQSPDFQKFQTARGYTDPDVAFREMRRELRHKKREQRDSSERKVAENVSEGQAPGPMSVRSRVRKLARPPSTPVQGAVSRTPVEVKTDGKVP